MSEPRTPERDRASGRDQQRVQRLQMTSPDERRERSQPNRVWNPPLFPDFDQVGGQGIMNEQQIVQPVPLFQAPRSPPRVQHYYAAPAPPFMPQGQMPLPALQAPIPAPPPWHPMPYNWGNYGDVAQPGQIIGNFYPMHEGPVHHQVYAPPIYYAGHPPAGHPFPPLYPAFLPVQPLPQHPYPAYPDPNAPYVPPNLGLDGHQFVPPPPPVVNNLARAQQLRRQREVAERNAQNQVLGPALPVNNGARAQRLRREREAAQRNAQVREEVQVHQAAQRDAQIQAEIQAHDHINQDAEEPNAGIEEVDEPEEDGQGVDEAPAPDPHLLNARRQEKERRNAAIARLGRERHNIGAMDVRCPSCHALHWADERLTSSSQRNPKFGRCCKSGQIEVPLTLTPPNPLLDLWMNNHRHSNNFLSHVRQYNNAFAFTSFGFKSQQPPPPPGRGPTTFIISGECYHAHSDLDPAGNPPQYAQLYVLDSAEEAAQHRNQHRANRNTVPELMMELSELFNEHHAYVPHFKQAYQRLAARPAVNIPVTIRQTRLMDPRTFNRPTATEVAVIVENVRADHERDIRVYRRDGGWQKIGTWNPAYACLHYVLFFPYGEHGFQYGMPVRGPDWVGGPRVRAADRIAVDDEAVEVENEGAAPGRRKRQTVSELEYYSFLFFPREKITANSPRPGPADHFGSLFRGKALFQQWLANSWVNIDESRLIWIANNQNTLRADLYNSVRDAVVGENLQIGQSVGRVILPASYHGGARQMQEKYQDSMAIARYLGPPQFFITMTANPAWPEIKNELLPGQHANDRPDLVARVFELKKRALLKLIKTEGILGKHRAHVYTIEFQKRGLPHMHLLLWTDKNAHIVEASDVDEVISAEIPDRNADPLLYHTVTTCMMHGPCGPRNPDPRCWDAEKKVCKKGYWPLKAWSETTVLLDNSYPRYRRREDGRTITKIIGEEEFIQDNRSVVPHNPVLSRLFDCHINVETVKGIRSIKYIHKYVFKGGDRVAWDMPQDEVAQHREGRYVSASEAAWHLAGNNMSASCPNVVRLQFHLEDQENIVFRDDTPIAQILANRRDTMLLAFFKVNNDPVAEVKNLANSLVYQEMPSKFTWKQSARKWQPRVRTTGSGIGRMPYLPATAGEKYFLRMLLTVAKGCTSFVALRTYEGETYDTYKECCIARGLLEDDGEWHACLEEAGLVKTGFQLRKLFAMILILGAPTQPMILWNNHRANICDDLEHSLRRQLPAERIITQADVYDYGLYLLEQLVEDQGGTMAACHMQTCVQQWARIVDAGNRLIHDQLQLAANQPDGIAEEYRAQLNQQQSAAFNEIYTSVTVNDGKGFFLDGPAGTGKTFLYKTLCYKIRSEGPIVLCVASSGIAALLLPGGRTSHSMFKIPLTVTDQSTCNINKNSDLGKLIQRTRLIIWDEVPMQNKLCAEAFDRTARDLMDAPNSPFGGITVVFGGDFRQTLPVIPHGEREDIIAACLKRSYLWPNLHKLRLTENMRLQNNPEAADFAQFLLSIGSGATIQQGDSNAIDFPAHMLVESEDALFNAIYPDLQDLEVVNDEYLKSRTILTARNTDVIDLNHKLLEKFSGEIKVYQSSDFVKVETGADNENNANYPVEYLNALQSASIPLSKLELKKGVPVMVLRNLAASQGVCNGSRGVITHLGARMIEMRLLTGTHAGQTVFIPRIVIETDESEFGFKLCRRQFPIRLAFAMTINKSQGQSVDSVGIHLETPVFSHGQLYVALSRCTSAAQVRIFNNTNESKTKNVVYKSVLTD